MSCGPLEGFWLPNDQQLTCVGSGPVAEAALWVGAGVVVLCCLWSLWRLSAWISLGWQRPELPSFAGVLFIAVAGLLLALAARQPIAVAKLDNQGGHLAVVVDISESTTREPGAFQTALETAASHIKAVENEGVWTSSITVFARGAALLHSSVSLRQLPGLLRSIEARSMRRDASDGVSGLETALTAITDSGQPGTILLLSDGNWTGDDAKRIVDNLTRQGVTVHVRPVSSSRPGVGIIAADLATTVDVNADSTIRMVLASEAESDETFHLAWRIAGDDATGDDERYTNQRGWRPVRARARFNRRGVQFVDISLFRNEELAQQLRLFTTVVAPPHILVLGEGKWAEALASERFNFEIKSPLSEFDPMLFDGVVIDGIAADRLSPETVEKLVRMVRTESRGLLLINGPHGADLNAPTTFMSYEETPLEPLLPVSSEARIVVDQPPPRDIIVMVDTSGSMGGWNLETAKIVARDIIDNLRSVDSARLVAFTESFVEVLGRTVMDDSGKKAANRSISRLTAGGGTNPTAALIFASQFNSNYCGLFFLSDGGFDARLHEPGCMTTVFLINEAYSQVNSDLQRLGQVFDISRVNWPQKITMRFFEPEPRFETYREGRFKPQSVADDKSLTPNLALDGLAISYPKPDAHRISVHADWPPDPVAAFREAETGTVGVFMSEIPVSWAQDPAGIAAIEGYLDRLIAWHDPDRFELRFRQVENMIEVTVTVVGQGNRVAAIKRLTAHVEFSDGTTEPLRLDVENGTPGVFHGRFPLPVGKSNDGAGALRATLQIAEGGKGAQDRAQRIPLLLPIAADQMYRKSDIESWTHGLNEPLLKSIAGITGGRYGLTDELVLDKPRPGTAQRQLYAWLIAIAATCIVATVAIGGRKL